MSKHSSTSRRESRNAMHKAPAGSLPLRKTWPLSLCVGLALGSIVVSGDALAGGPTGGKVVDGAGSIIQSGNQTTINQISNRLALNWSTFNVAANESVLFNQPGRSAVALNRILDQSPSQIFGKINSNGQVFLINTHGIIFGATAQLNVGGLMASTLDLTPKDFLAGNYSLNAVGAGAGVVNHGTIQAASGGSVSLVGGSVLNDGLILANYGNINLDGAEHATLDFDGDGLINIQITGELKKRLDEKQAAVSNKGSLKADDGTVVLQASAARDLFTNLVNNSGTIDAKGISTDGGVVRLVGNGGNVENSGNIKVSGVHGGTAQLLSDQNVGVTGGGIDASGTLGGGSIRVGGGWQAGEGLQTAAATYVAPDATLNADATRSGNGGSVVVWGNQVNNFYGNISARGGVLGGDGGQVETSSHDGLNAQGHVDASAQHGQAGLWLLDPRNVNIVSGGTGTLTGDVFSAPSNSSTIDPGTIDAALTGGTSVSIFTGTGGTTQNGDITLTDPILASGSGSLYLQAAGSILLNNNISAATGGTNPLNVYLWANYGGTAGATAYTSKAACTTCRVVIGNTASSSITTAGGSANIQTGDGTHAGGSLQLGTSGTITGSIDTSSTTDGALNVTTTGITQQGSGASTIVAGTANLNAGSGALTLTNSGNDFTGAVTAAGTNVSIANAGALNIASLTTVGGSGNIALTTSSGVLSVNTVLTGGDVNLNSAGDLALNNNIDANTLELVSGGNISQPGGFLTAATLSGSSVGSTSLVGVNMITNLGNFTAAGFSLANGQALTLAASGTVNGGTSTSLTTTSGDLTINGTVQGTTTTLTSAGAINEGTSGVVNTTTLTGSSTGDTTLNGANLVGTLGSFSAMNFALTNAQALSVSGSLTTTGNIGLTTTSGALDVNTALEGSTVNLTGAGGITLNNNVTTTGAQTYNDAVTLGGDAILASSGGAIDFASTVNGAHNLTVNTGGLTTFGGAVGASNALTSLTTDAGGSTSLGGNVTTSGAQHYGDAVLLGSNAMLATSNSAVTFDSTLDNATATQRSLTVNAGNGAVSFTGAVGGGANGALLGLTTHSGPFSANALNVGTGGLSVTTTAGGISQGGAFTVAGTSNFNAGTGAITLANSGNAFGGVVNLTGGTTQITNSGALTLGAVNTGALTAISAGALNLGAGTVAGALTATSNGLLNESGGLNVSGQASFTQNGSGADVDLSQANDFHGGVTISGAAINNLSLKNTDATPSTLTLPASVTGNLTLNYTNAALTVPVVGVGGNLNVSAGGTGITINGNVTTGGGQTYNNAVTLGNDATLASTGNGAIDFVSTIDGAHNLTVNTGGLTTFGGAVGATSPLTTLVTDAAGSTALGGNVTTSSYQIYSDAVTLGADAILSSTGNFVEFDSTVDGAHALTVNTPSDGVAFEGNVGSTTALTSLTLGAGGVTELFGNVTTSGAQTYGNAVTLLGASPQTLIGSAIDFVSTLDGAQALTVNASGATTFGGAVGSTTALTSLTTDAAGTTTLGGNVRTTGAQTYNDAVTLGGDATLTSSGGAIDFGSTVNGAHNLTVNTGGLTTFGGAVGAGNALISLTTDAGGSTMLGNNVSTTGAQTYNDAVLLGNNVTLATTNSAVTFDSTLDNATATQRSLTVNAGNGAVSFTGAVGGGANGALLGLTTHSGPFSANALNVGTGGLSVTTTAGGISQGGAFTVAGTSNFNAGTGAITLANSGNAFGGVVNLTGGTTQITNSGALTLGAVNTGALTAISAGALNLGAGTVAGALTATSNGLLNESGGLNVSGQASFTQNGSGADVDLSQANDFHGDVTISGAAINNLSLKNIDATPSTLTLPASVTGNLTLNYTNAALTVPVVGVGGNLDVSAGGGITIGGNVTTGGGQTYNNAVTLGNDATLASTGNGAIDFVSTTDGAHNLTVNTGGLTTFGGAVGATSALNNLITDAAGSTMLGGNVTTGGFQYYHDAVTLGGDAILSSTGNFVEFDSTVDGAHALTINTPSLGTAFVGNVGGTTALTSLTLGTGGITYLLGNVTTSGAQTYGNGVTLLGTSPQTLTGSAVDFVSTLDGAQALTVNASGATTFGGAVGGSQALTSLTTDAAGTTTLGGNISTTGAQTYNDAVTLGGDAILASSGGAIDFASTVNGAHNLTVNTGGLTTFGGAVGASNALTSLTTDAGGSTSLGGNVTTSGAQHYGDAVLLGSNAMLATSNSAVTFDSTLDNATATQRSLTVNAGNGAVSFTGAVGGGANGALLGLTTHSGPFSANALNVGTGGLSVTTTAGGISQGGAFTVAGTSNFNAGTGTITLTDANNDFVGAASLSGGTTQITDKNALTLGVLNTGALTAVSTGALNLGQGSVTGNLSATSHNGAISQNGALNVSGSSTINAGTGAITLTDANNDFVGATSLSGGTTQITDKNALTLGVLSTGALTATSTGALNLGSGNVAGNLSAVSHNGAISQSGALNVSGGSTINAGTGAITLTDANNDFVGAASLSGGTTQITDKNALTLGVLNTGALTATSTGALNLGSGNVAGNLSAVSHNGAISQSGALNVSGSSTINAGTGAITLTDANNDFVGATSLSGGTTQITDKNALTLGSLSTGALTATSTGALNLGSGNVAGNLSAVSHNGAISQSGALNVSGGSTINAGTGAITLTDANNDFVGAASLSGGTTQITDKNALTLGSLSTGALTATSTGALNLGSGNVAGNLSAVSHNGAISQSGALNVSGSSTINAGTGAITLTDANNDFVGAASLSGGTTQITDKNALTLGVLNTGALTAVSTGALNLGQGSVGGNLSATSHNGAISQNGALNVSGSSTINAGTGAITLTDANNDFVGAASLSGGTTQITDKNALTLGVLNTGALTAVSTGALNLGQGSVTGNLSATSHNGAISQNGALNVSGSSTINAGTGAITLTDANNDFVGAASLTGSSTQITDKNALTLGTVNTGALTAVSTGALNLGTATVGGNLSATSHNGAISQSGALNVSGSSTINAGTGAITLTDANNDFVGAASLSGGTTQITDKNALTLGVLNTGALTAVSTGALNLGQGSVAGNLSATSHNGAISQNGALNVSGSSTINAGTGAITLTDANNDFVGATSLSGGTTQITDKNALTLGVLSTGALTATSTGALNLGSGNVAGNLSAVSHNGAISQSGALNVSGGSTINAGTGAITLTDANNDFVGAASLSGGTTQITDKNALTLGSLSTGALTATSTGALNLGSGNVAGNLSAVSHNGAISQSGALNVSGSSTINAGTGAITLTDANNDFVGAASLSGGTTQITDKNALTLGVLNTGALTAVSTGALNLGQGSVGGNLSATSHNGAISQNGALNVSGSSTINAGTGAITLTDANNDFVGAASLSGGTTQITDKNALTLGVLNTGALTAVSTGALNLGQGSVTGNLSATSHNGAISQNGALNVSGSSTINAGTGAITLTDANNDFVGAASLTGSSTQITDKNALTLGTVNTGALTAVSTGALNLGTATVGGNLSATSHNGAISQSGALNVSGSSTINAGTGAITLTDANNDFVGAASLSGGTTQITDKNALTLGVLSTGALTATSTGALNLGSGNVAGNLSAVSHNGAISQSGALNVSGSSTINAGTGAITLTDANNDFVGAASLSGGTTQITDKNALTLGVLNTGALTAVSTGALNLGQGSVGGNLSATSHNGAISQNGALNVSGSSTINAGTGAITLTDANNDFVGATSLSGGTTQITDKNALTLGTVDAGALTVAAGGNLALDGAVKGGATSLQSGGMISQGANGILTVSSLRGQSTGTTTLNQANKIGSLGDFGASNLAVTNAQTLTVSGTVNGGASTALTTTTGDLSINGTVIGTNMVLKSAGNLTEGASGSIRAHMLSGKVVGNATLEGSNLVEILGKFDAAFSFTNGETLTVSDPLIVGRILKLTTTSGDLIINAAISGSLTTLNSAGAITQGAGGSITADTLIGHSAGATTLNGANHIGSLGDFSASSFALTNAQALTVSGSVNGGSSTALTTLSGDLRINGALNGTATILTSAGAITEGASGVITAHGLSGSAAGVTSLGSGTQRNDNKVDLLGNFSSKSGFSMTNDKTITLASLDGSAFTVDAGTSAFYLSVTNGDLLQQGKTWLYNGSGTWGSTGRMGTAAAPIYVTGVGLQTIANVGLPPAYFYAVDSTGNLLPLGGGFAVNIPTAEGAGGAQNGNHGDSYIDPGVITANYRSYGIVPSGLRLPQDQQAGCDPDQPDQTDCQDGDAVGMLGLGMEMGVSPKLYVNP